MNRYISEIQFIYYIFSEKIYNLFKTFKQNSNYGTDDML